MACVLFSAIDQVAVTKLVVVSENGSKMACQKSFVMALVNIKTTNTKKSFLMDASKTILAQFWAH